MSRLASPRGSRFLTGDRNTKIVLSPPILRPDQAAAKYTANGLVPRWKRKKKNGKNMIGKKLHGLDKEEWMKHMDNMGISFVPSTH